MHNKLFGVSPKYFTVLETFHLEFFCIALWLTDQNPKPLEIEGNIKIALVSD